MQNAGIYHIAAQHYISQPNSINSCVPRGSAPGPRWGLCPQTPTFSRYALVFLFAVIQTNKNCRCNDSAIYLLNINFKMIVTTTLR